jgi:hypothetical protein
MRIIITERYHVCGQKCSAYRLRTASTAFVLLMLSIKATFIITSAVSITCSSQLSDVVFLLLILRCWLFRQGYESPAAECCLSSLCRIRMTFGARTVFQLAIPSTFLTLRLLIPLPQMHFLT